MTAEPSPAETTQEERPRVFRGIDKKEAARAAKALWDALDEAGQRLQEAPA